MQSTTVYTGPTVEPLTLAEAKLFLRVETGEDDPLITDIMRAARMHLERVCWRAFITQTWKTRLDAFPVAGEDDAEDDTITVCDAPIQSVSSLTYVDSAGATQTLSSLAYEVDIYNARLRPVAGTSWPATKDVLNAIVITYVCGYGAAATDVPEDLRQALRLLVSHLYDNRSPEVLGTTTAELNFALSALIAPHRAFRF